MHGVNRNGRQYRDTWIEHSDELGALLLVPEFSSEHYPGGAQYNLGNVLNKKGRPNPRHQWTYNIIDDIFKDVSDKLKVQTERYLIFGHSAGAQFVHRMLYFCPDARIKMAVSANAGWYTFPDVATDFPYGLRGLEKPKRLTANALRHRLVVLLGSEDTDPDHKHLRRTRKANRQGKHRLERGKNFFNAGANASERLGIELNWTLHIVPDVGHSNRRMARSASKLFKKAEPAHTAGVSR